MRGSGVLSASTLKKKMGGDDSTTLFFPPNSFFQSYMREGARLFVVGDNRNKNGREGAPPGLENRSGGRRIIQGSKAANCYSHYQREEEKEYVSSLPPFSIAPPPSPPVAESECGKGGSINSFFFVHQKSIFPSRAVSS